MSALDIVTNDSYTSENVKRCSWCDYETGHAEKCQQALAQAELAALRARLAEAEEIVSMAAAMLNRDEAGAVGSVARDYIMHKEEA